MTKQPVAMHMLDRTGPATAFESKSLLKKDAGPTPPQPRASTDLSSPGCMPPCQTASPDLLFCTHFNRLCCAVQDVVALIAYEQPEQSPLAHLLQLSHREVVADAVNAAILQVSATASSNSSSGSSTDTAAAGGSTMPQVIVRHCIPLSVCLCNMHLIVPAL